MRARGEGAVPDGFTRRRTVAPVRVGQERLELRGERDVEVVVHEGDGGARERAAAAPGGGPPPPALGPDRAQELHRLRPPDRTRVTAKPPKPPQPGRTAAK